MNSLLIRRRGMMTAQSVAPHDGQLEWIETDGVAYIDSGFTPNIYSSAKIKALLTWQNTANWFCGVQNGTSNRLSYLMVTAEGNATMAWKTAVWTGLAFDKTKITDFASRFISASSRILSITPEGGATDNFTNTNTYSTPSLANLHLYIFANNNSGTPIVSTTGTKLFYFEAYSDPNFGTLVRKYVPWRLNGEVGLMDTLTNTFYGNSAGSGAFIGGPNVN